MRAQTELASELADVFSSKPLEDWLELFDGEDVSVGPVATLAEAAEQLASSESYAERPSAAGSANRSGSRSGSSP